MGTIDKNRIAAGMEAGTVRFMEDPNGMENVVCAIGDYWFYFRRTGGARDGRTVKEYMEQTGTEEIAGLVAETLDGLHADGFEDEYAYYDAVLSEHGI